MRLETELLEITNDNLSEAQFMASNFIDYDVQNRVFFNVIGSETVTTYLGKMGVDVENVSSIHSIKRIVEKVDIADIILDNIHIDVRVVFDERELFIPKSHYELGIVPDIYVFLKYDKSFQRINFIGFIEPSEIDLNNANDDYYFAQQDKLHTPFDMLEFIASFNGQTDKKLSDIQILRGRERSVAVADHDVTDEEFKEYLNLLMKSNVLRSSVLEYDNFETLAGKVARALQLSKEQREQLNEVVDFDEFINMSDENRNSESENQTAETGVKEQQIQDSNGDDLLDDAVDGVIEGVVDVAKTAGTVAGIAEAAGVANAIGTAGVSKEAMDLAGMAGDIVADGAEKLLDEDSVDLDDFIDENTSAPEEQLINTNAETDNIQTKELTDDSLIETENDTTEEITDETAKSDNFEDLTNSEELDVGKEIEDTTIPAPEFDGLPEDDNIEPDSEIDIASETETVEDTLTENEFEDDLADFPELEDTEETDKTEETTDIGETDVSESVENAEAIEDAVQTPQDSAVEIGETETEDSETVESSTEETESAENLADLDDIEINEDLDFSGLNFDELEINDDLISEEPSEIVDNESESDNISEEFQEDEIQTSDNIADIDETVSANEVQDNESAVENSDIADSVETDTQDKEDDFNSFDIGESLDINDSDSLNDLFNDFELTEEPSDNTDEEQTESADISEELQDDDSSELSDENKTTEEETAEEVLTADYEQEITDNQETAQDLDTEKINEIAETDEVGETDETDETVELSESEKADEIDEIAEDFDTVDIDDLPDDLVIDDVQQTTEEEEELTDELNPFGDTDNAGTEESDEDNSTLWDGEFTDVIEPDPEAGDDDLVMTAEPKQKKDDLISLDSNEELESIEDADMGMELPVFVPPENNTSDDIDDTADTHNFDELPTENVEEYQKEEEYGLVNFSDLADVPTPEPYNAEVSFGDVEDFSNFETIAPIDDTSNVDYFVDSMDVPDINEIGGVKENSVAISDKTHTPGEIFIDINRDASRVDISPTNEHLEELYNNNNVIPDENALNNGVGIMNEKGKSVQLILGIGGIALVVAIAGIIMLSVYKYMNPAKNDNEPPIPDVVPQNNNLGEDVPNVNMDNGGVVMNENQPQSNVPAQPSIPGVQNNSGQVNPSQGLPAQVQPASKPIPATSFLSVKKLSWEVPDYISAERVPVSVSLLKSDEKRRADRLLLIVDSFYELDVIENLPLYSRTFQILEDNLGVA